MAALQSKKRSRIPKSTKISGSRWRVVPKRQVIFEGEELEGICHFDHHLIEVTVDSGDEFTILRNFWHEIAHAIIFESGVVLEDNTEHAIINNFEKYLAANVDFRVAPRKAPVASKSVAEQSEPSAKTKVKRGPK